MQADQAEAIKSRERALRLRMKQDFEFYAPRCLKIVTKPDALGAVKIVPFNFNSAQLIVHRAIEDQRQRLGYVRAIVLKGRQQGISTYTEGRYYWKTTFNTAQKTYILTHKQEASDNLFAMVKRYHENVPTFVQPHVDRSNAKELKFDRLDSVYQVATAGAKGAGRSATLINVHGSEVAFWENAHDHLAGMLQAVPLAVGTEVILESTANGVGGVFHEQWQLAQSGQSDFIAIFVPWFIQAEYTRTAPDGFELSDDAESVPEGELTDLQYAEAFGLTLDQMYWRRRKITELGGGDKGFFTFKQEYPATPDEAFQAGQAGHTLFKRRSILKARRSNIATPGALIIGVDPGGDGEGGDPTAIIRRRTRRLFNPQIFTGLTTMQIAALCFNIIKNEKPAKMIIDVGGLGAGVFDRLAEMDGTQGIIVPVNFGEAALDPTQYKNRRAEMYWTFADWMDDPGGANIPDENDFQSELLSAIIAPVDSNQLRQLRSKEWMKSKGFKSPNKTDAAALTFAMPIGDLAAKIGSANTEFDAFTGDVGSGSIGNSSVDFDAFIAGNQSW